jgi:hypothetical protein
MEDWRAAIENMQTSLQRLAEIESHRALSPEELKRRDEGAAHLTAWKAR